MSRGRQIAALLFSYIDCAALIVFVALYVVFERLFGNWTFALSESLRIILYAVGGLLVVLYILLRVFQKEASHTHKRALMCIVCILLIGVPGIFVTHHIWARQVSRPYFIHDGALQNEAAFDATIRGDNPYAITYQQTFPEGNWQFIHVGDLFVINPAITHYIYLPATFLVDGVVGKAEQALFGFRDSRMLFFMCHVLVLFGLFRMVPNSSPYRNALLFAYGLNPFTLHFLAEGRNDILVFLVLCATFFLLAKKRFIVAGLCFGVACSLKQFAWLFAPALAVYFVYAHFLKGGFRRVVYFTAPALGIFLGFMLPFLLWDSASFIDDIISFPGGTSATLNYPISGFGASRLLVLSGYPPLDPFPFWIPVGLVGLVVIVVGARFIARQPTLVNAYAVSLLLLIGTLFFSRVLHDNYIIFLAHCVIFFLFFREFQVGNERNPQNHARIQQ